MKSLKNKNYSNSGIASIPAIFLGSILSVGIIAGSSVVASSIIPENIDTSRSGVCAKAYNSINENVFAIKCTYLDNDSLVSNPGEEVESPEDKGTATDPKPVSKSVPYSMNPPKYYVLADSLWSTKEVIDSEGNLTKINAWEKAEKEDLEGRGSEGIYDVIYDSQGRQIISAYEPSSRTLKIWRKNGVNFEYLGSLKTIQEYNGHGLITSADGGIYFTDYDFSNSKINLMKLEGDSFNKIREISYDFETSYISTIAVGGNDTVLYIEGSGAMTISKSNGDTFTKEGFTEAHAKSINDDRFIIGTRSGLIIFDSEGNELKNIAIPSAVTSIEASSNGLVTYQIFTAKSYKEAIEVRTYNLSTDEHLLWAYYSQVQ